MQTFPQLKHTLTYHDKNYFIYRGKAVGYLDSKQFAALMEHPGIMSRKLSTMETKSFIDLADPKDAIGNRLVFVIQDSKERQVAISSVIKEVDSSLDGQDGQFSFVGEDQCEFFLEIEGGASNDTV